MTSQTMTNTTSSTDATDAAHPAWWRGNDAGVAGTVERLTKILDGKDDGAGVISFAPLEKLRRRMLLLAKFSQEHRIVG